MKAMVGNGTRTEYSSVRRDAGEVEPIAKWRDRGLYRRFVSRLSALCLIVGIVCGFASNGFAATLRFHSNNAAVSSGVWMTTFEAASYLDQNLAYGNDYFVQQIDQDPQVVDSFPQAPGQVSPVVCFRIEGDTRYSLSNLKVTAMVETPNGAFSAEIPLKSASDERVAGGLFGVLFAVSAMPAGHYTVRLTASCSGYTSASATTSFTVTKSPNTLAQALGCTDAISKGLGRRLTVFGFRHFRRCRKKRVVDIDCCCKETDILRVFCRERIRLFWSGSWWCHKRIRHVRPLP